MSFAHFGKAVSQGTDPLAGKGIALYLAGLAEHVGNEATGPGRRQIRAAREFIARHHRRLLRRLALLDPKARVVAGGLDAFGCSRTLANA